MNGKTDSQAQAPAPAVDPTLAAMVGKTFRRQVEEDHHNAGHRFKVDAVSPAVSFGAVKGRQPAVRFTRLDTNTETIFPLKQFMAEFVEAAED